MNSEPKDVKNQRYYLMCQNSSKHRLSYYKIDKIRNIEILDANSDDINDLPSFSHGVNNEVLSDSLPYVFSDPQFVRGHFYIPRKIESSA